MNKLGPTKRSADLDDIMVLETQVAKLTDENKNLRLEVFKLKQKVKSELEYGVPNKLNVEAFKKSREEVRREISNLKVEPDAVPYQRMTTNHIKACEEMSRQSLAIALQVCKVD